MLIYVQMFFSFIIVILSSYLMLTKREGDMYWEPANKSGNQCLHDLNAATSFYIHDCPDNGYKLCYQHKNDSGSGILWR